MTLEIMLYIAAAMLVPAMGWGMAVTVKLLFIGRGVDDLVEMHRNPDNTGFGIAPLLPLLENNTKALQELVVVTREQMAWMKATQQAKS